MVFIDPEFKDQDVRSLYRSRRDNFKKHLNIPCVVLGISQEISQIHPWVHIKIPIQQNSSLLYFTGVNQKDAALLFLPSGNDVLFLPRRDKKSEFWVGKRLCGGDSESEEISKEITGFQDIFCVEDISHYIATVLQGKNLILGYFAQQITYVESLKKKVIFLLKKEVQLQDFEIVHYEQRCTLDESDLFCAKKSNQITSDAFIQLLPRVRGFCNEREIVSFVEEEILKKTAYGLNFPTIGASGENACVLHYEKNDDPLFPGELFLLDFGARWGCIGADVSRTFPISGEFSYLQRILYEIVLQTQKEVEKKVSPSITIAELNDFCWHFLYSLLEKEIIGRGGKFFLPYKKSPHGVSHLIGQVVHEGITKMNYQHKKLQPGWLISNEPGVYGRFIVDKNGTSYEENLGIRLEDDLFITLQGNINLSQNIPKEIKDIEKLLIS